MGKFLRLLVGLKPRNAFVLGRPVPPSVVGWQAVAVQHDRRISVGIFTQKSKRKNGSHLVRLVVWKAYQMPKTSKWIVSTSLFPDELDPAIRLIEECRRQLPLDNLTK